LFLALKTLPLAPGDEVITTPLTFAATANVCRGARRTRGLRRHRPRDLEPRSGSGRAGDHPAHPVLLPVHFGGLSCDMRPARGHRRAHDLTILEDAAHALGGRHEGRPSVAAAT